MIEPSRLIQTEATMLNRIRIIQTGRCWSHHSGNPVPAAYLWFTPSGNDIPLCEECCADWRARAVREPDLAPVRITLLEMPASTPVL